MKYLKIYEDYYKDKDNRRYEPGEDIVKQNKDLEIGEIYFDEDGDEIIRYIDCDDLPVRVSAESHMDNGRKSSGVIIISKDFSLLDKYPDNENILENCPIEEINNFLIYDDGRIGWDNNWYDDNLENEVMLYIYLLFNLDPQVRKDFNDYWEDSFDEEEIEEFKIKYKKDFKKKMVKTFNL